MPQKQSPQNLGLGWLKDLMEGGALWGWGFREGWAGRGPFPLSQVPFVGGKPHASPSYTSSPPPPTLLLPSANAQAQVSD